MIMMMMIMMHLTAEHLLTFLSVQSGLVVVAMMVMMVMMMRLTAEDILMCATVNNW